MFSYETNNTLAILFPANMHPFLTTDFFPNAFMMVNAGLVLLSIPIINYCLVPCLPKLTIRARLGMGLALYCVGSVTIIVIHAVNVRDNVNITAVQFYFLILPTAIYSFAESLTIVASEGQRYLVKTNVFGLTCAISSKFLGRNNMEPIYNTIHFPSHSYLCVYIHIHIHSHMQCWSLYTRSHRKA